MQIIYLSDRPAVLRTTWQHVRHFMPWIDRAIVVAPERRHAEFDLGAGGGFEGVTLVGDTEVSGLSSTELTSLDHVTRNVTLRRALIESGRTDDVFILSDDDYRPMRAIDESYFTDGERDQGYYFYELGVWPGDETDFDRAQHATHDALAFLGLPHLGYGAHMPQIMRRAFWVEAFELFDSVSRRNLVCEWALYFNVAQHRHPERFAEPLPFETMCWPQFGAEWPWWVRPQRWSFENFYPDLYEPSGLFDGLPVDLFPDTAMASNLEKIQRWRSFARAAERLEFPADITNPWTKNSRWRRAYFAALRPARKTYRYLSRTD